MANPTPEVSPEEASKLRPHIATGRSDYPNQINNVLCFPGIFRGALDVRAKEISEPMKMAAARAIAAIVSPSELREDYIIPVGLQPRGGRRGRRGGGPGGSPERRGDGRRRLGFANTEEFGVVPGR